MGISESCVVTFFAETDVAIHPKLWCVNPAVFHSRYNFPQHSEFANSFQQLNIDDMNVNHFILLSYEPQKPLTMSSVSGQATRYTNPSYWAGRSLPFGLLTMSVVRWSNKKYLNPSYLAGWPLGHEWSHISRKKLYCWIQLCFPLLFPSTFEFDKPWIADWTKSNIHYKGNYWCLQK